MSWFSACSVNSMELRHILVNLETLVGTMLRSTMTALMAQCLLAYSTTLLVVPALPSSPGDGLLKNRRPQLTWLDPVSPNLVKPARPKFTVQESPVERSMVFPGMAIIRQAHVHTRYPPLLHGGE